MNAEALELNLQAMLAPFRAAMERAYALGQQDAIAAITASVKAAQPAAKATRTTPYGTKRAKIREVIASGAIVAVADVAEATGIEPYRVAIELSALTKMGEVIRLEPGIYRRAAVTEG